VTTETARRCPPTPAHGRGNERAEVAARQSTSARRRAAVHWPSMKCGPGQNTSALDDGSPCGLSIRIIRAGTARGECALIKRPAIPNPQPPVFGRMNGGAVPTEQQGLCPFLLAVDGRSTFEAFLRQVAWLSGFTGSLRNVCNSRPPRLGWQRWDPQVSLGLRRGLWCLRGGQGAGQPLRALRFIKHHNDSTGQPIGKRAICSPQASLRRRAGL
jgi:hypothetical protein